MQSSFLEELDQAVLTGTADNRERALWHATDMLLVGRYSEEEIWVFGEIIGKLAEEIELSARAKLAGRLSRIDHAPTQIINKLACDDSIAVAGPVLRYSERIDVRTLLKSAATKAQPHLLAISKRRSIPEPVTDILVTRGDQVVAQSVAINKGARISEAGFFSLLRRSENDGILAEAVGRRQDIPRHLFQQLIAKASDETRRKLERERPDMTAAVDALVADVTASVHSKFGPASARYFAAKKTVSFAHRLGELCERSILEYARALKIEEATIALSLLCSLPSDVVERAIADKNRDLLLILAKAHDFCWDTVMALLPLRSAHFTISSRELDDLKDQFSRLHVSTAKDVLLHYRSRRAAS